MSKYQGIVFSQSARTISFFQDLSVVVDTQLVCADNMVGFLLEMHKKDFQFAIVEFKQVKVECLQWVRLIRRLRPKLPLIVICDKIDQPTEAHLHEERIYYLGMRPLQKETMAVVLKSAIRQKFKNMHAW